MEVQIFFHGVPAGESFWGEDNSDRNYASTFYSKILADENGLYVIQVQNKDSRRYCYYHYLVCKDVMANDGRAGSYFGMSVRFDAFCRNVLDIYSLLQSVYTTEIKSKLFKNQNGKLKYQIIRFEDVQETLTEATQKLVAGFGKTLSEDQFCSLTDFSVGSSGFTGNLNEMVKEGWVEAFLKKSGMIILSNNAITERERNQESQYQKQIQQIQKDQDSLIAKRAQEENELKQKIAALEKANKSLLQEQGDLKKQLMQANGKLQNLDSASKRPSADNGRGGYKNELRNEAISYLSYMPLINTLLLILILCIVPKGCSEDSSDVDGTATTESIFPSQDDDAGGTQPENQANEGKVATGNIAIFGGKDLKPVVPSSTPKEDDGTMIDVTGYNAQQPLKLGQEYTATIRRDDSGIWTVKGATIHENKGKSVKFTPNSEYKEDGKFVVIVSWTTGQIEYRRSFKVQ